MNMSCHITEERHINPWEGTQATEEERALSELTIGELMGEEHSVWLGKNKEFGFILELENDEGQTLVEKCIHPYAAESLAGFCRRYLSFYEKLEAA